MPTCCYYHRRPVHTIRQEAAVNRLGLGKVPGPSSMKSGTHQEIAGSCPTTGNWPLAQSCDLGTAHLRHWRGPLLALLPKADGGVRGLGLLEVSWKLCEAIIDTRVQHRVKLHDCLHGFTQRQRTVTATIEIKPQQELASIQLTLLLYDARPRALTFDMLFLDIQ